MTIEFTKFIGKAPELYAIQVTAENIEELAVWMGADSYSVSKTIVGGERKVTFNRIIHSEKPNYPDRVYAIVYTSVGDWIVKIPEQVLVENARMYYTDQKFHTYTQVEIDHFVAQQRDNGEIDFNFSPPYDR